MSAEMVWGEVVRDVVVGTLTDMSNYTMWWPVKARHELHRLPPISVTHDVIVPGIVCAIIVSLVRFFVLNPLSYRLGRWSMGLRPQSLEARRAAEPTIVTPAVIDALHALYAREHQLGRECRKDIAALQLNAARSSTKAAAASASANKAVTPRPSSSSSTSSSTSSSPTQASTSQARCIQLKRDIQAAIDEQCKQTLAAVPALASPTRFRELYELYKQDVQSASQLVKYQEAAFSFLHYLLASIFGFFVVWDKPYFRDNIDLMWELPQQYPFQMPDNDVRWYYVVGAGVYLHLFVSQFFDVRRKDFWQMAIHHVVTLMLIAFSWWINLSRIGSLVFLVHDVSDVLLQLAKLLNYMKMQLACDITFVLFAISFFSCRLVILPFRIMHTSLVYVREPFGVWFVYYFFNGLLFALVVLHVIWFSTIAKMIYNYLRTGKVAKDARSDSDDDDEDEDEEEEEEERAAAPETKKSK